jgi:hypothetical protein
MMFERERGAVAVAARVGEFNLRRAFDLVPGMRVEAPGKPVIQDR